MAVPRARMNYIFLLQDKNTFLQHYLYKVHIIYFFFSVKQPRTYSKQGHESKSSTLISRIADLRNASEHNSRYILSIAKKGRYNGS